MGRDSRTCRARAPNRRQAAVPPIPATLLRQVGRASRPWSPRTRRGPRWATPAGRFQARPLSAWISPTRRPFASIPRSSRPLVHRPERSMSCPDRSRGRGRGAAPGRQGAGCPDTAPPAPRVGAGAERRAPLQSHHLPGLTCRAASAARRATGTHRGCRRGRDRSGHRRTTAAVTVGRTGRRIPGLSHGRSRRVSNAADTPPIGWSG